MERFTDQEWEGVLGSAQPVAVTFWAQWCVPSRMAVDLVTAAARERPGRLKVGLLNVDENPRVASRYDIRALPTLLLLRGGQVAERRVGLMSREDLARLLDRYAVSRSP